MDEKRERDGGNTTKSWWMKRERERWREYYQELVDEKRERDGGNTTRGWWMRREREMEGILPGAGG